MTGLVRDPIIVELLQMVHELRPKHYRCDDDTWYSCPKAPEGCADDSAGTDCRCGADAANKRIDNRLKMLGLV